MTLGLDLNLDPDSGPGSSFKPGCNSKDKRWIFVRLCVRGAQETMLTFCENMMSLQRPDQCFLFWFFFVLVSSHLFKYVFIL